jgi:hypothetical protein
VTTRERPRTWGDLDAWATWGDLDPSLTWAGVPAIVEEDGDALERHLLELAEVELDLARLGVTAARLTALDGLPLRALIALDLER